MEVELEPRVKPLSYKVKAVSRESPSQKGTHLLDTDLRNHWSTGTNTKEWVLLELDEPCLLSHIRIYNKSVLEWEIAAGLQYKPETFIKVRPRCEASRRDMIYPTNYSPCRFVRISCLRGNPIAIFYIQLIGVTMSNLEAEFLPVVNYLLPQIVSHKLDAYDIHLQLLQSMVKRLVAFLPQLEADLSIFSEAAEVNLRFLAMLSGPFYPILHILNEREIVKPSGNLPDHDVSKNGQSSAAFTISSNFEPRRLRNASVSLLPTSSQLVFRPDTVFTLLRKSYKDSNLGKICRMASSILLKLTWSADHESPSEFDVNADAISKSEKSDSGISPQYADYSSIFGEEFLVSDGNWETSSLSILDIKLVEEGLLHLMFACASQPLLCTKLADSASALWVALPLVQALVPALRPTISSTDKIDDSFSPWKQPFVQHALSEIVEMSSSSFYRPLLRACAGYLSSFSPSHAKAACLLIDLCSSVFAPWTAHVITQADLIVELVEDFFGDIQGAQFSFPRARAALKCIVLAISGNMDDVMPKYKVVKHQILFLLEMLDPFLDPAMTPVNSMISFGNMPSIFVEKQLQNCAKALNVIHAAVNKAAVLPSIEAEWRRGTVAPSVLLSILEPHMQLPAEIDLCKCPVNETLDAQYFGISSYSSLRNGGASSKSTSPDDTDGNADNLATTGRIDYSEDASFFFASSEIRHMSLAKGSPEVKSSVFSDSNVNGSGILHEIPCNDHRDDVVPNDSSIAEYSDIEADYVQLNNYCDSEMKASEFRRFAKCLNSESPLTFEAHNTAVDALLLAAECYVNPYFMMSFRDTSKSINKEIIDRRSNNYGLTDVRRALEKNDYVEELLIDLESKRDKAVLEILLEAAELDSKYQKTSFDVELSISYGEDIEEVISSQDAQSTDAITLVRQNQERLCTFLIQRLQKDHQSMREILMQMLLFLLNSATKLICDPELVVDVILNSTEFFYTSLKSIYYQFKEGKLKLEQWRLHEVQRRWILLQSLVIASSGSNEESNLSVSFRNVFRFANLVPPSSWLLKIPIFSSSASPLVRYIGWKAVSRNAKQYLKDHLFLASNLSQLTHLLSIFSDELAAVAHIVDQKDEKKMPGDFHVKKNVSNGQQNGQPHEEYFRLSFTAIYPEISQFFPNLKKEFEDFGETILEAVGLQLKSLSSAIVPDLLNWFSDLCLWPFLQKVKDQTSTQKNPAQFKGFAAKNAKVVILFVLEAILSEHMEAMVPEVPRVMQVLDSLCRSCYCDMSFLDSVMCLLRPVISYSLHKVAREDTMSSDSSCINFESLCFNELLSDIRQSDDSKGHVEEEYGYRRALIIFVLSSVLPDFSYCLKIKLLQSSLCWAGFASCGKATYFDYYLRAYQMLMNSCKFLLIETMRDCGVVPFTISLYSDGGVGVPFDGSSDPCSFPSDDCRISSPAEASRTLDRENKNSFITTQMVHHLTAEEVGKFSAELEKVIVILSPSIDVCFKNHPKLAKNLALTSAECFMYSKCLHSIVQKVQDPPGTEKERLQLPNLLDLLPDYWNTSLEQFAEMILVLQDKHCWDVASVMLDCLLGLPKGISIESAGDKICSAVKIFSSSAPNISWRLQTDKWISSIVERGIRLLHKSESPLVDVFCSMLMHPEPEQRFIGLKHLKALVCPDVHSGATSLSLLDVELPSSDVHSGATSLSLLDVELPSSDLGCSSLSILSLLISHIWDQIVHIVSSDTSPLLRVNAMSLLMNCIPFVSHQKLRSLLVSADTVLGPLTNLTHRTCEGPITKFSLALIANICLHSQSEDISLLPDIVWSNLESYGALENERSPLGLEKRTCQAIIKLRTEENEAKRVLKEVLSSRPTEQLHSDFGSTRQSILQVISNFASAQPYFAFFSKEIDKKALEFEEAEIEMELLQKEYDLHGEHKDMRDWNQLPFLAAHVKDGKRLQHIKDAIRSLEKAQLREHVIARRQTKLSFRLARQKYFEEAAVREAELLKDLDRERTSEAEREIERQRLLELEHAKTRELQHNLDMEREKQTQRELQRELEQVESGGVRASRREYSSSHSSRPRYRERENGRAGSEGGLRSSPSGSQSEATTALTTTPKVVLSGGRQYSGQTSTILLSQDRIVDEYGSVYEENVDGSRDSGDTGSMGDPESVSALDVQSSLRRGSKSRQILERRERDNRGKWERKH